jgi:hypothetical protein
VVRPGNPDLVEEAIASHYQKWKQGGVALDPRQVKLVKREFSMRRQAARLAKLLNRLDSSRQRSSTSK